MVTMEVLTKEGTVLILHTTTNCTLVIWGGTASRLELRSNFVWVLNEAFSETYFRVCCSMLALLSKHKFAQSKADISIGDNLICVSSRHFSVHSQQKTERRFVVLVSSEILFVILMGYFARTELCSLKYLLQKIKTGNLKLV